MKIFREILGVQPQDKKESQGVQENHRSYFTINLKLKNPRQQHPLVSPGWNTSPRRKHLIKVTLPGLCAGGMVVRSDSQYKQCLLAKNPAKQDGVVHRIPYVYIVETGRPMQD